MGDSTDNCKLSQFGICQLLTHGNTAVVEIPTQKWIEKLNWASKERGEIFLLKSMMVYMLHAVQITYIQKNMTSKKLSK